MANVQLNVVPLVQELIHTDIRSLVKNAKNQSKIIKDWESLMNALKNVSAKIAKGEAIGAELLDIRRLALSLGNSAAEFGSMIPGPIGIACSVALAIVCLIPPLDGVGFLLNLMGCIPFAKTGMKSVRPLIEDIIRQALKSPMIKGCVNAGQGIAKKNIKYHSEYAKTMYRRLTKNSKGGNVSVGEVPNVTNRNIYQKTVGGKLDIHEGGNFSPEIVHKGTQEVRRTQTLGAPVTSFGNPLFNPFSHL